MEVYVDDMLMRSREAETHLTDVQEAFVTLRRYKMKLNLVKCLFGVSLGKFLGFMVSQREIEANPKKVKSILNMVSPRIVKEVQRLIGRVAALNMFISKANDKCLPFFKVLKPVSRRRRSVFIFSCITNNRQFSFDPRGIQDTKASVLHKSGLSGCRSKVSTHGEDGLFIDRGFKKASSVFSSSYHCGYDGLTNPKSNKQTRCSRSYGPVGG